MSYPDPIYLGGTGESSATLRPADADADIVMASGVKVSYLATAAQSAGEFGLYRWDFGEQAGGPAPHFHRSISESFFVLSGIVSLFDGTRQHQAGPGDFLLVPKGGIHSFRNDHGPASMLILFTPGAPARDISSYSEKSRPVGWSRHLRSGRRSTPSTTSSISDGAAGSGTVAAASRRGVECGKSTDRRRCSC
jgi:mannose-6-phosphate isomerase-like protein (cupin superfamily)